MQKKIENDYTVGLCYFNYHFYFTRFLDYVIHLQHRSLHHFSNIIRYVEGCNNMFEVMFTTGINDSQRHEYSESKTP